MTHNCIETVLGIYKNKVLKEIKEKIDYDTALSDIEKEKLINKLSIAYNANIELCIWPSELVKLRKKLFANKKILKIEYKNRVSIASGCSSQNDNIINISTEKLSNILLDYLVDIKAYDSFMELFSDDVYTVDRDNREHIFVANYFKGLKDFMGNDYSDFIGCIKRNYHYETPKVIEIYGVSIPLKTLPSAVFIRSMLSHIIDDKRLKQLIAQRVLIGRRVSGVKMKEEDLAYALVEIIERHYGILSLHDFYML